MMMSLKKLKYDCTGQSRSIFHEFVELLRKLQTRAIVPQIFGNLDLGYVELRSSWKIETYDDLIIHF